VLAVIVLGIQLQGGIERNYIPLMLAIGVAGLLGLALHQPWEVIQEGMFQGMAKVATAVLILFLIGVLLGVWILAGVVPTLIYHGLRIISPSFFLVAAFVVCVLMSVTTGTAYGTMGTLGIALMGIAAGLGVSAPMTAGAIIGGAYFGDKMSPLSETTNIAAAMGEVDLFKHIDSMMYTTIPAALVTALLYWLVGSGEGSVDVERLERMREGLGNGWNISLLHLIPIALMLLLAMKRVPAVMLLFVSVVVGGSWAVLFQNASLRAVFEAGTVGTHADTGVEAVDRLLSRGGIDSVSGIILVVLLAASLGGALNSTGVLEALVKALLLRVKSVGTLIVSVLASCYGTMLLTGSQILALVLPGLAFLPAFRERGVEARVMTRSLEDAGTISAPLIPWGPAGVFVSQLLGVPTTSYLPFVWFIYLVPVFSVICAYTGIGVWTTDPVASFSEEP
jgi:NhaC family Na+:H+ antiporter